MYITQQEGGNNPMQAVNETPVVDAKRDELFNDLLNQVWAETGRFAKSLCKCPNLASDIVIEAVEIFYNKFDPLKCSSKKSFRSYLFSTIRSRFSSHNRKKETSNVSLEAMNESGFQPKAITIHPKLGGVGIQQYLANLDPRDLGMLLLDNDGKSNAEIARKFKISVSYASNRLAALKRSIAIFMGDIVEYIERGDNGKGENSNGTKCGTQYVLRLVPPIRDWLTMGLLQEKLGRSDLWIRPRLKKYEKEAQCRKTRDGRVALCYPPRVLIELQQENEAYLPLGDFLVVSDIMRLLGEKNHWVRVQLDRLGVQPEFRISRKGKLSPCYSPETLETLRSLTINTPKAGGWLTTSQMAENLKRSEEWVKKWVARTGFNGVFRRGLKTGSLSIHYPPQTLDILRHLMRGKAPAGWVTKKDLVLNLHTSWPAIDRILEKRSNLGRMFEDRMGNLRTYYPHEIIDELKSALGRCHD